MNIDTIYWRSQPTQDDVEAIHVMVAGAGVFSAEETDVAVELAEDALSRKESSDYRFVLADIEGRLIGYSCFGRIPLTDDRYDLYWIVVDGSLQQQGIATGLLAKTEEAIQALGGKALYAETSSRNVYGPAHGFYRAQGFDLLARLEDFYADGDDKLIFAKRLRVP